MRSRRPLLAALTTVALAAGVLAGFAGPGTADEGAGEEITTAAASAGGVKIAYYDQWSVYGNAFYPKYLDTRGIAAKLDVINYSFGNIHPTELTCFEANRRPATTPIPTPVTARAIRTPTTRSRSALLTASTVSPTPGTSRSWVSSTSSRS